MRRLSALLNASKARAFDDRGSAMASVIGLLAVSMVITTVIVAATVQSYLYTADARASVQSQAAADAGIDATFATLKNGTCSNLGVHSPSTGPAYAADVFYQLTASGPWIPGCPTPGVAAIKVKVVSTGTAANDADDNAEAEAVYAWTAPRATGFTGGPAVYAYDAAGFGGSGRLISATGNADVMVKTGDVSCTGASTGADDLVVDGGKLTISGSCSVAGNVWASKALLVEGGTSVGGNAVAASITVPGSSWIGGSAWATGDVRIEGAATIGGDVTAQNLTLTGSAKAKRNAWVYNATTMDWSTNIAKNLTTKTFTGNNPSGNVSGTRTLVAKGPGPSAYPTPIKPTVPDWVDYDYKLADWVGYTEQVISGATCGVSQLNTAVANVAGRPVVIDARTCTNGISLGGVDKVSLGANTVIIAKKYDFGGSAGFTAGSDLKLWLITPDTVANKKPDCPAGANFAIGGAFTIPSRVSTMYYSPCLISLASGLNVTGQIFAGQAAINGAATLHYVPVGLPGVDLDTGSPAGGGSSPSGSVGDMEYYREVAAG